ncbi:MAG TPA: hypothetical protein VGI39_03165 [Polyangiaceae bacterium]|jgi:hypothetical protein
MSEDQYVLTDDGQGVVQSDLNAVFMEAALADDRLLAELLRLSPYSGGGVSKCIVPYRVTGAAGAMVQPNGATGSVKVFPFRAVVGSRTVVSVAAGSALASWRDIRSKVYAASDDNENLGTEVSFAPNASGFPRWDLVYVQFIPDAATSNVLRNVRAPGSDPTDPPVETSLSVSTTQVLALSKVTGTAAASPLPPSLPADGLTSAGPFYIPLAFVLIPNGFTGSSIVLPTDIAPAAPIVALHELWGVRTSRAPLASTGFGNTLLVTWGATRTRPSQYIPPTRTGGVRMRFPIDASGSGTPLIADAGILDLSRDWRNRDFTVTLAARPGATHFAWETGAAGAAIVPKAGSSTIRVTQEGQSYKNDSLDVLGVDRGAGVVCFANNANFSPIAAGSNSIGLYVDMASGALKLWYQGTPGCLVMITVEAEDAYDNA